jgi:hypothetical protein
MPEFHVSAVSFHSPGQTPSDGQDLLDTENRVIRPRHAILRGISHAYGWWASRRFSRDSDGGCGFSSIK